MKRTLLFMACVLASLTMLAQKYYPEGTKWTEIRLDTLKYDSWYSKVGDEWVPNFETIEYYVKGEYTDNNGDKFKCVYTNGPEWTDSLTLLLQEAGDAEYVEPNSVMVSVLIQDYDWNDNLTNRALWPGMAYQFDWSVGKGIYYEDILYSNTTAIPRYCCYYGIIDEIKEDYLGGVRPLKYVDLDGKAPECGKWDNPQNVDTQGGRIIQGIGITEWNDGECLFGAPRPYEALGGENKSRHYRSKLVHFERNGEVLYDVWPEKLSQQAQGDDTDDSDYIPLVKEGKSWHMVVSKGDECNSLEYMLMNGEVVKDGKTYFRLYSKNGEVVRDLGLLREEGQKVYFYDSDIQEEILLFDYSLKPGDTFETFSYDDYTKLSYKVISVGDCPKGPEIVRYDYDEAADSMIIHRRNLRQWTVRSIDNTFEKTWIECIGSFEGPLANLYDASPISTAVYLAYVDDNYGDLYLPFSFHNSLWRHASGCDLPKGVAGKSECDGHHHLTYELEGDRLHVYGEVALNCASKNNYAYFIEESTEDPLAHKLHFEIDYVTAGELATCESFFATDFYVPGSFDPNINYIVVDNNGEEHPVINKTQQMAYRPFVEDGKVWKVGDLFTSGNSVQLVEYYYFDGDTIIDGKTCKQMMCQRYVNPDFPNYDAVSQLPSLSYVGAWYEENKQVYFCDATDQQFKLMYDFSLEDNGTFQKNDLPYVYVIGPRKTGGIKGFKGVYRDVLELADGKSYKCAPWMEGVGGIYGNPKNNVFNVELGDPGYYLMSCTVGDEVIYLNDDSEDGATPAEARKRRFDFTHTIKTKPKARTRSEAEQSLYGEYNEKKLGINLDSLDDAYQVRITEESGKAVYEKNINAGNIVGLNIDISSYAKGRYTVSVENSTESFTGEFEAQTTGIRDVRCKKEEVRSIIYNLQGQRISSLQKGLNIVNGQKVYVK